MQYPVVVYETDPLSESRLSHLLEAEGLEVLDVQNETSLLQLVEQTALSLAFISIDALRESVSRTAQMIRAIAPETTLVLTGHADNRSLLARLGRSVGAFTLNMPPDPAEFRILMQALSTGRGVLDDDDLEMIADDDLQEEPASSAAAAPFSDPAGSGLRSAFSIPRQGAVPERIDEQASDLPTNARSVLFAFMERAFETFMALETRNLDLRRELLQLQDPERASRLNRPLRVWVCHPDGQFAEGMSRLAPRLRLDISSVLTTGGEVLDRLAADQPDLLLIADQLPDIPAELVVQSIQGASAATSISLVRGWGTEDRSIELLSHDEGQSMAMRLESVNELISVIETVKLNTLAADMGRDFARAFRETHQAFLKDYGRLRQWLERG
ncbi:MAG: hypothetical protein EA398_06285 [Deltaproteobacteria bacterium]|nr:MAG: hypothetical protein EA398_06285 [Deltaproteobacteria bacterium]